MMNKAEKECQQIASAAASGIHLVDLEEDGWVGETTEETLERVWPLSEPEQRDLDEPMGAEEATERSERRLPALREPVANYRVAGQAIGRSEQRLRALHEPTDAEEAIERHQPADEGMGVEEVIQWKEEPANPQYFSWHDKLMPKSATKKATWADESERKQSDTFKRGSR